MSSLQAISSLDSPISSCTHHAPSSSGEVLVRVEGVGKKYCRDLKKSLWYGAKDVLSELNPFGKSSTLESDLRPGEFWANKDISFELRRGECLGLIGRNGAGKTTLLKMLNGLTKPDMGRIEMRGRVGALIALGAGFNPILTGRENIYVNGSILGLSRQEIDEKIDDIIDFSEIKDFIDAPVQSYSSGMQVRLGFSVASSLNPDVLILDEVLAVGDFSFKIKCLNRIEQLLQNAAVIFVSHQSSQIRRICNKAMYLNKGNIIYAGEIGKAFDLYDADSPMDEGEKFIDPRVQSFSFKPSAELISFGQELSVSINIKTGLSYESNIIVRLIFFTLEGEVVGEWNSVAHDQKYILEKGICNIMNVHIPHVRLRNGVYRVWLIISEGAGLNYIVNMPKAWLMTVNNAPDLIHASQI